MTDLRIDPLAFLDDRDLDLGVEATRLAGRATDTAPAVASEPATDEEARQLRETAELLAKAGLDRVPTVEEAKALLDARRAEIRREVLLQADERNWCYDGTRQVCANLRLAKPDEPTTHRFRTAVTMEVEVEANAFTKEGALRKLLAGQDSTRPILSAAWFNYRVSGVKILSSVATPIEVDGTMIPVGDPTTPTQEGGN